MSELWLEVTLPVPAERLERVCDVLTANGMTGLVVEEEGDFLRFLEQNRQYWDYVDEDLARRMKGASRVKFYVPDSEEGQKQLRQYLAGLEDHEILPAHPGGEPGVHRPGLDAGAGGARRAHAPVSEPRTYLRHRGPPHHPAVFGAAGGGFAVRRQGAGLGLWVRDFGHRGAGNGGVPGDWGRY